MAVRLLKRRPHCTIASLIKVDPAMRKILLIDDDEKLAQPLQQYFARFDLSLSNETNPLSAIERIQHETFDLLILDVMLPGIDGFRDLQAHTS